MENKLRLVKLEKTIVKTESDNSNYKSRIPKSDELYGPKNSLLLTPGKKVGLEMNICPKFGCSNGSTGVVKHILYEEVALHPQKHPTFFWAEIYNYTNIYFFPPKKTKNVKNGFQLILYK